MATATHALQERFDRDSRTRPAVLFFVIACHILLALLIPRLFPDEFDNAEIAPPVVVVAPLDAVEPITEEVPPEAFVFEETQDPGLSGGRTQSGIVQGGSPGPERARIPDPAIRLTMLEVASGSAATNLDLDRLGSLAGPIRQLGEGAGTGGGAGNGSGLGDAGNGEGGIDTTRNVAWSPRMNPCVLQSYMPRQARRQRIYGLVVLECTALREDRVSDCAVIEEHPQGFGFGEAALATERHLLLQVTDSQGNRIYGERIRPYLEFRVR